MVYFAALAVSVGLASVLPVASAQQTPIRTNDRPGDRITIEAHRGGLGLRPENTLWAFAYAMEMGADTLEMDMVWTGDGYPVIWHDHDIDGTKCEDTASDETYVGRYIANLTLAQVKTLDCGSRQLLAHPQQERHATTIPTLGEVLELMDCYGASGTTINLEKTKLDPVRPNETLPVEKYIDDLVPYIEEYGFGPDRVTIQSFDWRTLIGIKEKFPAYTTVALLDDTTIIAEDRGSTGYPWLGGIDLQEDFQGDWVAAAHSIGAGILSSKHGVPSNVTYNSIGYEQFTTPEVVQRAHELGMKVIPWTVDYEVTIDAMISADVDGIISNYPERVAWIARQRGLTAGRQPIPSKPECLANAGGPR